MIAKSPELEHGLTVAPSYFLAQEISRRKVGIQNFRRGHQAPFRVASPVLFRFGRDDHVGGRRDAAFLFTSRCWILISLNSPGLSTPVKTRQTRQMALKLLTARR